MNLLYLGRGLLRHQRPEENRFTTFADETAVVEEDDLGWFLK